MFWVKIRSGRYGQVLVGIALVAAALSGCTPDNSGVITEPVETTTSLSTSLSTTTSGAEENPSTSLTATPAASSEPATTDTSSSTSAWPADFTPPQQEAAKLSLQVVAGFIAAVDRAEAAPSGNDWTAEIRRFSADPLASQTLQGIQSMVQYDIHAESAIKYDQLAVVSADDNRVVVSSCMDSTTAAWIDPSGANVLESPALPRQVKTFVLSAYDAQYAPEGWLVFETDFADPATPC